MATPRSAAPPVIRRARPDELDAVGRLTVDAYVGAGVISPDAMYLEFLGDAAHRDAEAELWVAVDDARGVLGTVTFVETGSALRRGGARRRGRDPFPRGRSRRRWGRAIGEALTRHTIAIARERGYAALVLSSATTMHAAHRLYERLGFTRLPERDWSPAPHVSLVAYTLSL